MSDGKWDVSRLSSGERSALKRCSGVMMGSDMQAVEAFYRALNIKCKPTAEKAWFAAMCLECLWHIEDHPVKRPFEEMLRSIYQNPQATDSTRKRCTSYLNQPWGDDGFLLGKISALVRMMRAQNGSIMPDFEALADDLTQWNHNDRYIQRRWIRTICTVNEETKEDNKKEETPNVD